MILKFFNMIKTNETYNLIYFAITLIISIVFVFSRITSYYGKKFSKSYVNEMTELVKKSKETK